MSRDCFADEMESGVCDRTQERGVEIRELSRAKLAVGACAEGLVSTKRHNLLKVDREAYRN